MEVLPLDLSVKVSEMIPEPVPLFVLSKNEPPQVPLPVPDSEPTEPLAWSSFLAPLRTARLVHEVTIGLFFVSYASNEFESESELNCIGLH